VRRRINIFRRLLDLHLRHPKERDRAIGPCNYIRCGETSKEVDCSIGSAWVEAGTAFDERGHSEV